MKLQADFSSLLRAVEQMGAVDREFDLRFSRTDVDLELDVELERGKEIVLDNLEVTDGVLSLKGRQVLLYIPDQGFNIKKVLEHPLAGRRFHIADCVTLETMRKKNRFDRYKVTNNLSGIFDVYGIDNDLQEAIEGNAALSVCKNCLKHLNYKGYVTNRKKGRQIFNAFEIGLFFSEYSSLFKQLPKGGAYLTGPGYTQNWGTVSEQYRKSAGYLCEECGVDLNAKKGLLHTHHMNGNKQDNQANNLKALCVDCHRKEPFHERMFVKHQDMQMINRLRRQQNIAGKNTWQQALKLSDPAMHGLLHYLKDAGEMPPEVGYELINNEDDTVIECELAWPTKKKGIVLHLDCKTANKTKWNLTTLGEAMKHYI